jgi:AcrR family transcriptional regulator
MALSANKRRSADATSATRDRVMEAAEEMIRAGEFAQAAVTELADKAGVSRATVFSRFGSKLGVLEALAVRCAGSPQMLAIRAAAALPDPADAVTAMVPAACEHWELQGHILLTLKAVAELEPGAIAMVEEQDEDQRSIMDRLARGLERDSRLNGLTRAQAAAALHTITSVETFIQLRRNGGLSLAATKTVLSAMAAGLFDLRPAGDRARRDGVRSRSPSPG